MIDLIFMYLFFQNCLYYLRRVNHRVRQFLSPPYFTLFQSKSYGADFQQRYEALQKQVAELSKSVGSKEFLGKSEKFYDSIEQQSKELSLKAAEALKSHGLPEQQQAQLKQFIEATAEISAKVQVQKISLYIFKKNKTKQNETRE